MAKNGYDAFDFLNDDMPKFGSYPLGYRPMGPVSFGFGGGYEEPFSVGNAISSAAAGLAPHDPDQSVFESDTEDKPGAFSQLGSAIAGVPGKIGEKLGGLVDWGGMKPMEKAQILSAIVSGGAGIYSGYKQGKEEDEEKKRRQRSADAMRPFYQNLIDKYGG